MRKLVLIALSVFWTTAAQAQPVKIGDLGILADAPFYIAIEKGYFAAEGVQVVLERFNSAAQATAPLSTDQVQVVGGGVSAALYNAFARDWPVRIVMARTRDMPGYSSDTLILRNDLKATVKSAKDLKGRVIAINTPASVLHFMLGRLMETDGLTISDVQTISMAWPNMGPGIESKAIDGGTVVEPFAALYAQKNIAFPFRRAADFMTKPPLEVSVMLYSKAWMEKRPDEAKAFSVAFLKGVRDYYDAMKGGPKRAEVIDICIKYTSLKDKALYDKVQWSYMDPNAEISFDGLRDQQDWYAKNGFVPLKANLEGMVDLRFLKHAQEKLGRVEVK
ncbi:MAG: ABC transporter substrate-binding protein [Alphaproteobacteria bacterium]|nr:ABC transporter substrate-binding protein [Alphaproteobacteria bacterium]